MIKSGGLDALAGADGSKRAAMLASLDRALEQGAKTQRDRESGQIGFFDMLGVEEAEPALSETPPWTKKEQLNFEKDSLGFYASGHPLEAYAAALQGLANVDGSNITERPHGDQVAMGGIVIDLAVRTTKKGDRFALFRLEDQFTSVKIVCWPEQFNRYKALIEADNALLIKGRLEVADDGNVTIVTQEVQPLDGARAIAAREMAIKIPEASLTEKRLALLSELFNTNAGHATVTLELITPSQQVVRIRPNQFLRIKISPELEREIQQICADWAVSYLLN
jgi:DNA polymerase III subunit alpha